MASREEQIRVSREAREVLSGSMCPHSLPAPTKRVKKVVTSTVATSNICPSTSHKIKLKVKPLLAEQAKGIEEVTTVSVTADKSPLLRGTSKQIVMIKPSLLEQAKPVEVVKNAVVIDTRSPSSLDLLATAKHMLKAKPRLIAISPKTAPSPTVIRNSGDALVEYCYYNTYMYACTHTGPAPSPRVIHIKCTGIPLGKVRCENMGLHPKYQHVDRMCPECSRDDLFVQDAKTDKLKATARNMIMANLAKGWNEAAVWEAVDGKNGDLEPGLVPVLKKELMERNAKAMEDLAKRRDLADSFSKLKLSDKMVGLSPTITGLKANNPKTCKVAVDITDSFSHAMATVAEMKRADLATRLVPRASAHANHYEGLTANEAIALKHAEDKAKEEEKRKERIQVTKEKRALYKKTISDMTTLATYDIVKQEEILEATAGVKDVMKNQAKKDVDRKFGKMIARESTKDLGVPNMDDIEAEEESDGEEVWNMVQEFEDGDWIRVPEAKVSK